MALKAISVLFLVLIVSTGYGLREIRLPDLQVNHITHPYLGRAISIQKDFWDTLQYCHVIFPNGVMFEAYPNYNIPHPNVYFLRSVPPFTSCGIGFRGVGVDFSGIYELLSTVLHSADNSWSMTRRRFNITVSLPYPNDGEVLNSKTEN